MNGAYPCGLPQWPRPNTSRERQFIEGAKKIAKKHNVKLEVIDNTLLWDISDDDLIMKVLDDLVELAMVLGVDYD